LPAYNEFIEAISRLIAVLTGDQHARNRRPLQRKLQRQLARAFRAQGGAIVAGLESHRKRQGLREADGDAAWLEALILSTEHLLAFPITEEAQAAILLGALTMIREIGGPSFDLSNPRAVQYLTTIHNRIAGITEETFRVVQAILVDGVDKGASYAEIAREIRIKFADFSRDRSELIAVTEIGDAYSEGQLLVGDAMQLRGINTQKRWLTAGDDRVEAECEGNEAAGWIPMDDAFPSGHERPLAHPRCRCALGVRRRPD
jgi:Phage Mu protein F like protein